MSYAGISLTINARIELINSSDQSCREYPDMTAEPSQNFTTLLSVLNFNLPLSMTHHLPLRKLFWSFQLSRHRGKDRRRPARAEAAIRCYRRGRRASVFSQKKITMHTLVSIREKIMAIYYPEDWRPTPLTALANEIAIAEAQCSEGRY